MDLDVRQSDQPKSAMVSMTKAVRGELRAELKRTGLTATSLLTNDPERPFDLKPAHVSRWISGIIKTAPKTHVAYVMERLRSLPDKQPTTRNSHYKTWGPDWISISDQMAEHLRAELIRTGYDQTLIAQMPDVPEGLNKRIIQSWIYREAKSARKEHWDFVVRSLAELPGDARQMPPYIRKPRKPANRSEQ